MTPLDMYVTRSRGGTTTYTITYHCIIIRCATLEFGGYHFNQDEMYTYVHTMIVIEFLTEETTCVIKYS